jgi:hypothetical protein
LLQINYRVVEQSISGEITCSVIPESAAGGYPESRCNAVNLDAGSHPPQADSPSMTIVVFSEIVEQYRYTYFVSRNGYNVFS